MNKVIDEKNKILVYIVSAAVYFALLIIAYLYGDKFGGVQQSFVLVGNALGIGFYAYLKINEYDINLKTKIYEKKSLYIVYMLVFVLMIGNYYAVDASFSENSSANIWLIAEAISVALGMEVVIRALGGYCFPKAGVIEESFMIAISAVMCLPAYICGASGTIGDALVPFVVSIGIATMMTGFYLRYHKLGANMALNFILYYLANVTQINSTADEPVLGNKAAILVGIAAIGMFAYGSAMLKKFNQEGVFDDSEFVAEDKEKTAEFREAFSESKDKYKEKVSEKTAPAVEARKERYFEKKEKKAEKRREKEREKYLKESAKADKSKKGKNKK